MAKKTRDKSDDLRFDKRVSKVADWILEGRTTRDIIALCIKNFKVDERMAYNYRVEAFAMFREARKEQVNERIDFYVAALMKLFQELEDKTTPTGAAVAKSILVDAAKVEGAIVNKVDVTSKGKSMKPSVKIIKSTLKLT